VYDTDLVQAWLDSVALSHSGSKNTENLYRYHFGCFLKFINATPEDIRKDSDAMPEKQFRQKYAQAIRAWCSQLMRENYTQSTISSFNGAVKSFFKYSDFPLSYIPVIRRRVVFHNRDIEAAEIVKILSVSAPRERAFYTFMAQSGLRPTTICNLRLKHIEPDFSSGKVPPLVNVPEELTKGQYHGYITFFAEDAIKYLKAYLNTRRPVDKKKNPLPLTKDSYLFVNQGTEEPMVFNTVSSLFRKAVRMLKEKGEMDYDQKQKSKPAEIRLYSLRKFFRKMANQAGFENVEYWMGHTGPGVDASYRPKDPEFYRAIYAEKAMPFLRLESATPSETEKQITQLAAKNAASEERIARLEALVKSQLITMEFMRNPGVPKEIDRLMEETKGSKEDIAKLREWMTEENRRTQQKFELLMKRLGDKTGA